MSGGAGSHDARPTADIAVIAPSAYAVSRSQCTDSMLTGHTRRAPRGGAAGVFDVAGPGADHAGRQGRERLAVRNTV